MNKHKKIAAAVIAAFNVVGCSTPIGQADVMARADRLSKEIQEERDASAKRYEQREPLFVRVATPYLSGRTVALSKNAKLPPVFSQSSGFVRPPSQEGFTLPQIADLITKNYGIRVRVRPDVFLPAWQLVPGSGASKAGTGGAAGIGGPMGTPGIGQPAPIPPVVPPIGGTGAIASANTMGINGTAVGYESKIDFDYTGSLSEYLARVSSKLGINWEWAEADQELVLYRLVRKTFTLDISPSVVAVKSSVSKSSSATSAGSNNSGIAGGGGGVGTTSTAAGGGSNGGSAEATYSLNTDPWSATVAVLNGMRTYAGKVEPNPFTRTITIIDTRDVVTDAERFIAGQNEILGRQVLLQMRLVRLSVTKLNQLNLSLDAVLQRLSETGNPNWRLQTTGASSVASGTAGTLAYAVLNPSHTASGTALTLDMLRENGIVTDEFAQDIPVKNNRSVPISDFSTFDFLQRTTPGTGGGLGGSSVPGLVPGTVSSGTAVVVTPTIKDGDSLSLVLSLDRSSDPTFTTASTGNGETFQQIQLSSQRGLKIDTEVDLRNNQTLVLMGLTKEAQTNTQRNGITSFGNAAQGSKDIQLLFVTPRIVGSV